MMTNITAIQPYSYEPDAVSDEENKDGRESSRLQVNACQQYLLA